MTKDTIFIGIGPEDIKCNRPYGSTDCPFLKSSRCIHPVASLASKDNADTKKGCLTPVKLKRSPK